MSKQPSQQFLDELTAHDKFVLNCCLRLCADINDAEDLRQDVFIKAIRFHENFVSGTNMKGWLVRITKNTFINSYRKKAKNPEVLRDNGFSGVEEGTVVDYDEIMSFDQDDQQHLSEDLVCAIKSRLFRARGILRDKLRDKASSYGISYVKKKSNRKKG